MFGHPDLQSPAPTAEGSGGTDPARLCVLVASDQQLWISSLDSVLTPHGYRVVSATTSVEALEQIDAADPDIIIVQSSAKGLPGLEICRSLRSSGCIDAATPVIILTAAPCTREARISALKAGAWDCFGFPLDPEMLLLKLAVYARARREVERVRHGSHGG